MSTSPKKKLVHFVRHGQSTVNLSQMETEARLKREGRLRSEHSMMDTMIADSAYPPSVGLEFVRGFAADVHRDTRLTAAGTAQAEHLRHSLSQDGQWLLDKLELVVASCMSRALKTASIGFKDWLARPNSKAVVERLFREYVIDLPCDRHRDTAVLAAEFPEFDFSGMPAYDDWWGGEWVEGHPLDPERPGLLSINFEKSRQRARKGLKWLVERPETYIAVVGHGGFVRTGIFAAAEWASPGDEGAQAHATQMPGNVAVQSVWLWQAEDGRFMMEAHQLDSGQRAPGMGRSGHDGDNVARKMDYSRL